MSKLFRNGRCDGILEAVAFWFCSEIRLIENILGDIRSKFASEPPSKHTCAVLEVRFVEEGRGIVTFWKSLDLAFPEERHLF